MKSKYELANLSVNEAIEALTRIADLSESDLLSLSKRADNRQSKLIGDKMEWLNAGNVNKTTAAVKGMLSVLLNYIRDFYKKESTYLIDPHAVEGIKAIMILVSEAAKKIDTYISLHQKMQADSIVRLKEYRQLQDIYHKKIVRQIDEGILSKWILGITSRTAKRRAESEEFAERKSSHYLFVDLDALKHDLEYELLFIRKEDGSHFFSPRLIRNMKLVSNFSAQSREKDPLVKIKQWQDSCMYLSAKNILRKLELPIKRFYREAFRFRHHEIVAGVSNCIMALMLCACAANQKEHALLKSCRDYFFDFQYYLHELLAGTDYHHLLAYPPAEGNKANVCALELINAFCRAIYVDLRFFQALSQEINSLVDRASLDKHAHNAFSITEKLQSAYSHMQHILKYHQSGPMRKILDAFEQDNYRAFDPFLQKNFASLLFLFSLGNHTVANMHVPCPTHQEYIHRAAVLDEFKAFLRSYGKNGQTHLLINLQDRTSWKEHARVVALEELALHSDFKSLVLCTIAKDTNFYYQLAPYDECHQYPFFIEQFKAHFTDEASGYFFPAVLEAKLVHAFIDPACAAIHRLFFSNKNTLTREQRLDFIEIFYLFLVLKLIDLVKPTSFSLSCKDGVDIGSTSSALLFLFLKLLAPQPFKEWEQLNFILFGPALLNRERAVAQERFARMLSAAKTIEFVYREVGFEAFGQLMREAFGHLYSEELLQAPPLAGLSP